MTFKRLGHRATALRARPGSRKWRVPIAAAKCCSRTSYTQFAEQSISTAYSPTRHCFTVPSPALPRVLRELHAALKRSGVLLVRTRAAMAKRAGAAIDTAPSMTCRLGAVTCQKLDS